MIVIIKTEKYDDYMYEVVDELEFETNFVFFKLHGKNRDKLMTYGDVEALSKRFLYQTSRFFYSKKKIGFYFIKFVVMEEEILMLWYLVR